MYQDLIYDFDGTLSDTYPVYAKVLMELLARYGIEDTYENVYAKLKISVGHAINHYNWGKNSREVSREFHDMHTALALQEQKPFPEAREVLQYAAERGKRNFLYTHTDKLAYRLLEKWGLDGYFTDAIDSSMKFPRKPAPDALIYLMGKNKINAPDALMVGDRDIDIQVGHHAGIAGCLFDFEHFYSGVQAEHHIVNLTELKEIMTLS